jgi:hypothetical protein
MAPVRLRGERNVPFFAFLSIQEGPEETTAVNETLLSLEQAFQYAEGMPFGDQYRSLYASPTPFNGYASWMLPGLRPPSRRARPRRPSPGGPACIATPSLG